MAPSRRRPRTSAARSSTGRSSATSRPRCRGGRGRSQSGLRYRPAGVAEEELDELNRRLGQAVLDDGRVYFGTTVYGGKVAFRPAIVNWRTRAEDVDLIVPIALELGASLAVGV